MGIKVQRTRCFLDIGISNVLVGRVVVELFSDVCPKTCENFRCLCTGEKGVGKGTQKPLHYKGCLFHRVVKDFMIQGGDFSEGNGRGGESIYGGFFEDESFAVKHNKEYLLSMANRGKDTNGSQFFITTKPSPHLDGVHVVFGHVISGQEVVQTMENQKTDPNSRPYSEVKVLNCGELIPKSKAKKEEKKKERASSSSSSSSTDSDSSSKSSSESSESEKESKKKKKKAKKLKKKQKKQEKKNCFSKLRCFSRPEAESAEEKEQEDLVTSTLRPEEIPPIPENRFLMRRSPQAVQNPKEEPEKNERNRDERQRESAGISFNSRSAYNRRLVMTRSGRKIKGRGPRRYRTPSRSRSRSRDRFRMRAVTGERWIKGDNEAKDDAAKAPRRERKTSNTRHENTADGKKDKKDKKTRSDRSKSKDEDTAEKDEKQNKHKAKKRDKSQSRSKSREKSKRSKSRERGQKNKSDDRRGRSRSKERSANKKEKESESNHSKDREKGHDKKESDKKESDKKNKEDTKGRNGERTRTKSKSKERSATKDRHRSSSRNRDKGRAAASKEKEDRDRARERSRSQERRHNSERENKKQGSSRIKNGGQEVQIETSLETRTEADAPEARATRETTAKSARLIERTETERPRPGGEDIAAAPAVKEMRKGRAERAQTPKEAKQTVPQNRERGGARPSPDLIVHEAKTTETTARGRNRAQAQALTVTDPEIVS
uniref:peptidylprolyl isomerase n=1 Tax=Labrus bergylta TaxID=56723 RepID=A0A3Q3MPD1_9LABR